MTELKMGIYRHYKGRLYLVIGLAKDANAEELYVHDPSGSVMSHHELLGSRTVVVYVGLEMEGAGPGPRINVRTLSDFQAVVCQGGFAERCSQWGKRISDDGLCAAQGHGRLRFEFVGEGLSPDMLA